MQNRAPQPLAKLDESPKNAEFKRRIKKNRQVLLPTTAPFASAVLSPCGLYRYDLWRRWSHGPYCLFIGVNPSTANGTFDDPTIRKCMRYAKRWGFAALCMANLFAFRATDPDDMKRAHKSGTDIIGPSNDRHIATGLTP